MSDELDLTNTAGDDMEEDGIINPEDIESSEDDIPEDLDPNSPVADSIFEEDAEGEVEGVDPLGSSAFGPMDEYDENGDYIVPAGEEDDEEEGDDAEIPEDLF